MKKIIVRIDEKRLHHPEYYQMHSDIKDVFSTTVPEDIGLPESYYLKYSKLIENMDEVLEPSRKSGLTDKIETADAARDISYRTLRNIIKGHLTHKDISKKEAAENIMLNINLYGHLAKKNYAKETAKIHNLVEDLKTKRAADINILNINDLVDNLETDNNECHSLIQERDFENSLKSSVRMTELRKEVNTCYNEIILIIETYLLLNPNTDMAVINHLNSTITRYKTMLAYRKGRQNEKSSQSTDQQEEWTPIPPRDNDKPYLK